jgi:hypothetical protein
MKPKRLLTVASLIGAAAAGVALAQQSASPQPQTTRLRGVVEKIDGRTVVAKSSKGEEIKLNFADKALVVAVVKASIADIKPGMFIGSGAMPQPDGSHFCRIDARHGGGIPSLGRRSQFHDDERHGRRQRVWRG